MATDMAQGSREDSPLVSTKALSAFAASCLRAAGVGPKDAELTADVLVVADTRGIDSHGVARLPRYVRYIRDGRIDPRGKPSVVSDMGATVLVDAGNSLGPPAALDGMRRSVEKAARFGVGLTLIRRGNHFGIAGYYAAYAASRGMIGVVMTGTEPLVAPVGGVEPLLGTNPIAVAMPTGDPPFLYDAATSAVTRGAVELRVARGESLPDGWLIDREGRDVTDPRIAGAPALEDWAILPLGGSGGVRGGHKGYGLGLLVELLCGPLAGASWSRESIAGVEADIGQLYLSIRVDAFTPVSEFSARSHGIFNRLRSSRRAPGVDRILVPGEIEAETGQSRERFTPLSNAVLADLNLLGRDLGVPFDAAGPKS